MTTTVSSETIDSLAAKLADFADALSEDERHALDLFFLQPSDVEGFEMADSAPGDGPTRTNDERRKSITSSLSHGLATYYPPERSDPTDA